MITNINGNPLRQKTHAHLERCHEVSEVIALTSCKDTPIYVSFTRFTAAYDLEANRIVCDLQEGKIGYPDLNDCDDLSRIIGMTTKPIKKGDVVEYQISGKINTWSSALKPNKDIYLSYQGMITQDQKDRECQQKIIGRAESSTDFVLYRCEYC